MFQRKWNRCFLVFIGILLCAGSVLAQEAPAGDLVDTSSISSQIDTLIQSDPLKHAFVGIEIESLKDGKVIYSHNADSLFMPASNMKLVTSSATLDTLGPDCRFKTEILSNGSVKEDGKLAANLILKGYGDPVMEYSDLSQLTDSLKKTGIQKISGDLIVDDTYFDDQRLGWGWSWDDEPYYYAAQASALVLHRNVVDVTATAGKAPGLPVQVKMDPSNHYVSIENNGVTGPKDARSSLEIGRRRAKNIITLSGVLPLDSVPAQESVTVEDPALYTGYVFSDLLKKEGIIFTGSIRHGHTPQDARVLASHESDSLSAILPLLNKPSDNLIAETLLRDLGAYGKDQGTVSRGADAVSKFLKKIGGDPNLLDMEDGSGLSRMDLVSPTNLVAILRYMYSSPNSKVFMDSLPIAGVDGTLEYRMRGTAAEKIVHAKTGYINHVSCLSGYLTRKNGDTLIFSMMMNHYLSSSASVRNIQDQICEILAGSSD